MTPQPLRASYGGDDDDLIDAEQLKQPERLLRLFLSLPVYAENERRQIVARLSGLNYAFSGSLRILPFGSGIESAAGDGTLGAADCDAVIAVLRPRFADDPETAEQAEARGGAAGLVSAMGKGGDAGLPDIYIFRHAGSPEQAAADTDWQSGKRAFETWFRARGGQTISFDDFFSAADFAGQLDERLGSWLTGLGFEPPAAELVVFEPAVAGEPLAPEPAEAAAAAEPGSILSQEPAEPQDGMPEPAAEAVAEDDAPPPADWAEAEEAADHVEPETLSAVAETMPEIEPAPAPEILKSFSVHTESSEVVRRDRFRRLTNFLYRRQATYTPPVEPKLAAVDAAITEPAAEYLEYELLPAEPEAYEPTDIPEAGDANFDAPALGEAEEAALDDDFVEADDAALIVEGEYADPTADDIEMPAPATFLDELEALPEIAVADSDEALPRYLADEDDGALIVESGLVEPVAFLDEIEPIPDFMAEELPERPQPMAEDFLAAEEVTAGAVGLVETGDTPVVAQEPEMPPEPELEPLAAEAVPDMAEDIAPAPMAEPTEPVGEPHEAGPHGHVAPAGWAERATPKVVPLRPEREPAVETAARPAGRGGRAAMQAMMALTAASLGFGLFAGMMWFGAKSTAAHARDGLAAAAEDAGNLVFRLTEEARRFGGATSEGNYAIVEAAEKLHGALLAPGRIDTDDLFARANSKMDEAKALTKQNKLADALKSTIEGQRLFQTLVDLDPGQVEWQKRLAATHQKVGDAMIAQSNLIEALGAYRNDVAIRKMLSAKDPDNVGERADLSAAQVKVGDVLAARRHLEDALSTYRDALAIRKTLALSYANNAERQRDLMEIDNKVADVLSAQNHLDEALGFYRDALAITGKMAVMNPADPKWRDGSAKIDIKIGDVLVNKGRVDDALASYRDGLATMKDVAANDPNSSEWQGSLAGIHERIGDAFVTESHFESALASYRDALAIVEAMVAKDPKSASWRHAASEAQLRIGQALFSQNSLDGALAAHRESLNIIKALAAEDPNNSRYQHDLMMGNNDIGIILNQKGVRAEALEAYREARRIAEAMGAKEPNNADWATTRAMVDNNLGSLQMDIGNRDEGVAAYRDGAEVSRELVERDPRNAEWQAGLAVALYNLGEAGVDSEANFAEALDLLKRLDDAGALRPDKKALIPHVEKAVEKLRSGEVRKRR